MFFFSRNTCVSFFVKHTHVSVTTGRFECAVFPSMARRLAARDLPPLDTSTRIMIAWAVDAYMVSDADRSIAAVVAFHNRHPASITSACL